MRGVDRKRESVSACAWDERARSEEQKRERKRVCEQERAGESGNRSERQQARRERVCDAYTISDRKRKC